MVEAFSAVVLFAAVFVAPLVVFSVAGASFLEGFTVPHFEETV